MLGKRKRTLRNGKAAAAPTDAGTYRVTATVAADDNYKKASSTPVEFTISKAGSTISVTESLNKDYDGSAVNSTPTVSKSGSTGNVTYTWEKKKTLRNGKAFHLHQQMPERIV
ncbi:MBG domain-containing protein [Candidatus Stoquefichus massiliensis]|uniref:MBG domain-containing protein n=1 Tax=Candidatus Stoquefichus massiliensis TaxID=1470350 RepID=UPI001C9D05DF